jgi:thiol-disulfide isomerase/thioredoxin
VSRTALAAVVAIVVIVAAAGGYLANRNWSAAPETALPEQRITFVLPDLSGTPRSLDERRGRPLLVNFWATWCAPCRREIPLLKQAQAAHGDNLQVIGVAVDYVEEVIAYAETAAFNYPVLVGQEEAMAAAETSGLEFLGLPFTMVITADGRLIKTHMGEILETHLEEIVAVLERLDGGEIDVAQARESLGRL